MKPIPAVTLMAVILTIRRHRQSHLSEIFKGHGRRLAYLAALMVICLNPELIRGATYDLRAVKGIETFNGSVEAKDLLAKNGFVVADPSFKQIFEPYIKSPQTEKYSEANPRGSVLPSFITVDSAWHTYHVLLEEGVKNMEEVQSQRLLTFSRRLLAVCKAKDSDPGLVWFASVGLAFQDEPFRNSLAPGIKRIVDGLKTGSEPVPVPVGFDLAPAQFRAQSFYTQSPELSDYFAARQWYANVVFRLSDPQETKLAISLTALVNRDPELSDQWSRLCYPIETFLAHAEDGTIKDYTDAAESVLGYQFQIAPSEAQSAAIRQKLMKQLPLPQVNDQLLSPEQYPEFAKLTRGFRLLPPQRLPDAVCFNNTVNPKIPGRTYPSGLDFLAASPELHSPAAVRAVQGEFGKNIGDLISKAECGRLPDSLYGEAMQLLATLQKPLPSQVPAPLRTEAWSDLQLWTQLGAWAEQRHTWALHSKMSVSVLGMINPPTGMVAPYPEFFSRLAKLTHLTAMVFDKFGLGQSFEIKPVATDLLTALKLSEELSHSGDQKGYEKNSAKLEQLGQFNQRYYEKHRAELEADRDAYKKVEKNLLAVAQRCAMDGTTNAADIETLRIYYDCRQNISRLLNDFAPVCDRLAALAAKSLKGETLTDDDAKWIENYGVTLAGFNFYYGNSYEVPRDDFPMVTRVFSSPLSSSMLYAGLARPQALYVIIPNGKTLQLYRGAVMTYREFIRDNAHLLDDESWRELVFKGQTPPAPPFTRSFYAETTVGELLKQLQAQSKNEDANYGDVEDILWQIGSRATDKDWPALFEMMTHTKGEDGRWDIVDGLAEIISRLPWQSHQKQLAALLGSSDAILAKAVARILIAQPESLDATLLTSNFNGQPAQTRRLYCAILGRLPHPTEATHKVLLDAMHDRTDGVRWQAALAAGKAGRNDAQTQAALLEAVDDTNQFVGAMAAYSLARSGATNSAPALFAKLKTLLQSTPIPVETLERQSEEIRRDFNGEENHAVNVLDPDRLETRLYVDARVTANLKRMAAMRLPPRPFNLPMHNFNLAETIVEALGDLHYAPAADEVFKLTGTDYDAAATAALGKLAPDRLTEGLLATAGDKQTDSYLREKALLTLCNISATNCVRDLIPLLDDTTPIEYSRPLPMGLEWRICDRAAATIATLLGWEDQKGAVFIRQEQRDETMNRVREWAKQTK